MSKTKRYPAWDTFENQIRYETPLSCGSTDWWRDDVIKMHGTIERFNAIRVSDGVAHRNAPAWYRRLKVRKLKRETERAVVKVRKGCTDPDEFVLPRFKRNANWTWF